MADLTDEDKKILEEMERDAQRPLKPIVTPNPKKFTDNVLVPASEYRDWHEVAEKGQRRTAKATRIKKPNAPK